MERAYDCEKCDVTVTFEVSDKKAIANASYEDCRCPDCGAVLAEVRCDWGGPFVVSTVPRPKKVSEKSP